MTVIFGYDPDPGEPVDLEAEAERALAKLRADPAGERLAEMLPDMLMVGVSYAADLFSLLGRYRAFGRELARRQLARERARSAAPQAFTPQLMAPTAPKEETGPWKTLQTR